MQEDPKDLEREKKLALLKKRCCIMKIPNPEEYMKGKKDFAARKAMQPM